MEKNKFMLNEKEQIDKLGINDLEIIQNADYFMFGTDSVLLANFVVSNSSRNDILDLCSGSGVVPILVSSKVKYNSISAVELQDEMYDLLIKNVNHNNINISTIQSDVKDFSNIKKELVKNGIKENVNIITVNPPYKTKGTGVINENKVKYAARHEEFCTLEDIFKTSSKLLESKGKLYIVHKPERMVDLLSIARKYNLEAKRLRYVYPKLNMKPSIVLIEYSKDGGNEIVVEKPLIEYDDKGNYTKEFLEVYGGEFK